MNSYFFLSDTNDKGNGEDDATALCDKYGTGKRQTYYGNGLAVCAIEAEIQPKEVEVKTRQEIIDLNNTALPDFNGTAFINVWENTRIK